MSVRTAKLEYVCCAICRSGVQKSWRRLNGYAIVCCGQCGFAFVNPRPSEQDILRAYSSASEHEAISFASAYQSDRPVESYGSWTADWVLHKLIDRPGLSFLDIGAGQGWAVGRAGELGADAYGYEIGDHRAFENNPQIHSRIFSSQEQIEQKHIRFDRLHLSAVLEHVCDPVAFLKSWLRFLKPGGIFCVAGVPNRNSLFIRAGWDGWDGNIPPHHLNYFTPKTLRLCVAAAGGRVKELCSMGIPQSIHPLNMFRQSRFESALWGDRAQNWAFASKPASCGGSPGWAVGSANRLLRVLGGGANLYAFFVIDRAGDRMA